MGLGGWGIIQLAVSSFWPDKNKTPVAYFYASQDFPLSCRLWWWEDAKDPIEERQMQPYVSSLQLLSRYHTEDVILQWQ